MVKYMYKHVISVVSNTMSFGILGQVFLSFSPGALLCLNQPWLILGDHCSCRRNSQGRRSATSLRTELREWQEHFATSVEKFKEILYDKFVDASIFRAPAKIGLVIFL